MHTENKMIKLIVMVLILSVGGIAVASVSIVQHKFHYFGELTGEENADNLLRMSKTNEAVKITTGIISNGREFIEYHECSPVYTQNNVDYYYERELFKRLGEGNQCEWAYHPEGDAKKSWAGRQFYMCGHTDSIKQGDERFALVKGISTGQFYVLNKFWNEVSFSRGKFDKATANLRVIKHNYDTLVEFDRLLFGAPSKTGKFKISSVRFSTGMEPHFPPHYEFEVENVDRKFDRWIIHFDFINGEVEILVITKPR